MVHEKIIRQSYPVRIAAPGGKTIEPGVAVSLPETAANRFKARFGIVECEESDPSAEETLNTQSDE